MNIRILCYAISLFLICSGSAYSQQFWFGEPNTFDLITREGKVGIGPSIGILQDQVHINNDVRVEDGTGTSYLRFSSNLSGNTIESFNFSGQNLDFSVNNRFVMNLSPDGKVGIGNPVPFSELDVVGEIRATNNDGGLMNDNSYLSLKIQNNNSYITHRGDFTSGGKLRFILNDKLSIPLEIMTLSYQDLGRVGIGIQNPLEELHVNGFSLMKGLILADNLSEYNNAICKRDDFNLVIAGKAVMEEILVESQQDWCDYVFEEGYKLMPIEKLKSFIGTHHHLPNIPSAKEIEANGIALGEMVTLQMEKIEELTLYTIYQEETILSQSQVNQQMHEEIAHLKEQLVSQQAILASQQSLLDQLVQQKKAKR